MWAPRSVPATTPGAHDPLSVGTARFFWALVTPRFCLDSGYPSRAVTCKLVFWLYPADLFAFEVDTCAFRCRCGTLSPNFRELP